MKRNMGTAFGTAVKMVATSPDLKAITSLDHSRAAENLKKLEDLGCKILHGVDAKNMSHHPFLLYKFFDRIIFNMWGDRDMSQIHVWLPEECIFMLTKNGETHVTHKIANSYSKWEIEPLAWYAGLYLIEKERSFTLEHRGFNNKRGYGIAVDCSFPIGACPTFFYTKFGRP
ncbi:unnamed protein product [Dovyalis caffra]|uniref:25S rRNA (uridine-N(3))-methyltransferase BMT5-like domain-containing protein n=1 Tax=Dovyalis caffra TaxID=77055 RepID=A0AAV1QQD7_9ROSI|nr:unnamed protein product [Dovyalis caffra]